ncbi:L,D-transpeptidase scaffold domain-containing protein [Taibaiella lutea]|nr:L,D-transpeptidase family protein [Taibaiella lutea]
MCCSCNQGKDSNPVNSIFSSDYVDVESFKEAIQKDLPPCNTDDSTFNRQLMKDNNGLLNTAYAYKLNEYKPIWMDASGLKPSVTLLISQLKTLQEDGLDTGKYGIAGLEAGLQQFQDQKEHPFDSLVAFDKDLTNSWLLATKDLLLGSIDIKKGDSLWFARNDSSFYGAALLITSLKADNTLPSLDTFRPDSKIYDQMKKALINWQDLKNDSDYVNAKQHIATLKNDSVLMQVLNKELQGVAVSEDDTVKTLKRWISTYQYYHQLKNTGTLDSNTIASLQQMPDDYIRHLRLNMDRIRALPRNLKGEQVWVTIPLMEVDYIKDDAVQFHSRVVVGKVSRQTPTIWANMTNIVFNPPWGVPPTILKNDVGPGVGKSGGAYLAKKGLRAFDSKGKDVTSNVNISNYKRYTYRQPPGADNSLGEVKFNLPNAWDIYLHDTPHRENFGNRYRALSSGCVRVQNPKQLAEIILNNEKFTADKIDTIISTRKTKTERLGRRLPVYIIYATVAEDSVGNQLRYLNDVYKRDESMRKFY